MNGLKRIALFIKKRIWINKMINGGAEIGVHTVFSDIVNSKIDSTRPWLLSIGDYCVISSGVTILTHDYSLSTLRRVYGEWIGEGNVTRIGDNCFIGMDVVILMGSKIGNNVIVGAGSVVHGCIPDNVVVAGNPARVICTLDEYYLKRKKRTIDEANICAERFFERFDCIPKPKDLAGFKFLFCPRDSKIVNDYGLSFSCSADEPKEVEEAFYNSKPYWNNYEDFLNSCDFNKTSD